MPLVEKARQQLPPALTGWLPDSVDELRVMAIELARKHAGSLQLAGKETARGYPAHHRRPGAGRDRGAEPHPPAGAPVGPLARALSARCQRLADAFHNIVFAQIKISLINTVFTAIFLLGALPLFGIHVPLAKTLVVITFVVGLLPVIGNLHLQHRGDRLPACRCRWAWAWPRWAS